MSESCSTCHFRLEEKTVAAKIYYCRRFPPEMQNNLTGLIYNLKSLGDARTAILSVKPFFPEVKENWWCGEYK